ncbi:S8 family serine peptidase [Lentzea sp. NPDC060358]|uniref:S8 family serine peptidase n=1 Tax=Lentzea sp. NPDC060358 TaxID=3347103 RepID=UPI00364D9B4C
MQLQPVETSRDRRHRIVGNSSGPSGGGAFDPESVTVKLQRQLVAEGVIVWANGNDGGDGSANLSNPPGIDPTPGVISVASYDDRGTGTRDGGVSDFSSRGLAADPRRGRTSPHRENGPGPLDPGTFTTISGASTAATHISSYDRGSELADVVAAVNAL